MMSLKSSISAKKRAGSGRSRRNARSGAVALEFAILAIPFFMWMMYIFELSYDLFTQQALDFALHAAVRQIQTGNAQDLKNGGTFVQYYFCPATKGLLECNNIYIRVQATPAYPAASATSGNTDTTVIDYSASNLANGALPVSGDQLGLGDYVPASAANLSGNAENPSAFCNASGGEAILVSAIYIGPSFISGLLPGVLSVKYGTNIVHATLSTAGFVTEPFIPNNNTGKGGGGTSVAASC